MKTTIFNQQKNLKRLSSFILFCSLFCFYKASAQKEIQTLSITSPTAISVSGDIAIIGDIQNKKASIFQKDQNDTWAIIKNIIASDGAAGITFGRSVSISDTIAIVSDDFINNGTGAVYIFYKNQGGQDNWGEVKKLTLTDAADNDYFGASIAIEGNTLVVGSYGKNNNTGAVYVFHKDQGGIDNWGEVKKITANDAILNGSFGSPVAISGDNILVGNQNNMEAAYIFNKNEGGPDNWGQVKKLTASNGIAGEGFGTYGIAISGDIAIVGLTQKDNSIGAAYIYEKNQGGNNNWGEVKKITPSNGNQNFFFGKGVSIYGDKVLIGTDGSGSSYSYVFAKNRGNVGNWEEAAILTPSNGAKELGGAVALSANTIFVGDKKTMNLHVFNAPPTLELGGNNTLISNSNNIPNPADNTDFGNVYVNNSNSKNFTIKNTGGDTLKITNTSILGLNTADFSITSALKDTILPGESSTFEVTFAPTSSGSKTAQISFLNNDPSNAPFLFNIKGTGLTITINSPDPNDVYGVGKTIHLQVSFGNNVDVTAVPALKLETGTTDNYAYYKSGSGTTTLNFEYTVQAGDVSADLDYTGTDALDLLGGAIKDSNGNDVDLTLPPPGTTGSLSDAANIVIDGIYPTLEISSTAPATVKAPFTVTFTFSENVSGFTATDVKTINATASNFTEVTPNKIWTATITPINSGETTVFVDENAAQDVAGNANVTASLSRTYDAPTGINLLDKNSNMVVYPNPVENTLFVSCPALENQKESTVTLYTITGTKVCEQTFQVKGGKLSAEIDMKQFSKGIYLLKIQTKDSIIQTKISKL